MPAVYQMADWLFDTREATGFRLPYPIPSNWVLERYMNMPLLWLMRHAITAYRHFIKPEKEWGQEAQDFYNQMINDIAAIETIHG